MIASKSPGFTTHPPELPEYEYSSEGFRQRVQENKYDTIPGFGPVKVGRILLQDHGYEVSYRNIKLRLPSVSSGRNEARKRPAAFPFLLPPPDHLERPEQIHPCHQSSLLR